MFNNGAQFLFFPCEIGNSWLFQQARCEVIVKYTNCNLLEHAWIRTGIRTLEAQIDEKNKSIEAWQNVTGFYKKRVQSITFLCLTDFVSLRLLALFYSFQIREIGLLFFNLYTYCLVIDGIAILILSLNFSAAFLITSLFFISWWHCQWEKPIWLMVSSVLF